MTETLGATGWTMTGKEHREPGLHLDLSGVYTGRSICKSALICPHKICTLYTRKRAHISLHKNGSEMQALLRNTEGTCEPHGAPLMTVTNDRSA